MSGQFNPLQIPPGVVVNATKKMRSSNWSEANAIRWVEGLLQPIGGQQPLAYSFASPCRAIHCWYDLAGNYYVAYLCEENVYVDINGSLTEITPSDGLAAPSAPPNGYGMGQYGMGDYGAPPRPGATLQASYTVLPDMYSIDNFGALLLIMSSTDGRLLQWDPAETSDENDVQTLTLIGSPTGGTFTLTFGNQTTSALAWNAAASDVENALEALSNIGSGNVACAGGPLPSAVTVTFQGDLASAPQPLLIGSNNNLTGGTGPAPSIVHTTVGASVLLTPVPNAPGGRCFVCTGQSEFVMVFGALTSDNAGSARRFCWCNQGDITDWSFASVTSQAGYYDIEPGSPIVTAHSGRAGWVVFFTEKKAYVSRYLGLPFVYDYEELADDCTPWSPASITTTSSLILWMSEQGMFSFDGTSIQPVQCMVRPWILNDVDPFMVRWKAACAHIGKFNEFWWLFPQNGQLTNTRGVIYNYKEGWWSQLVQMPRSCGMTSSYATLPIFADGLQPYRHEIGNLFADCALPYADTFDLNLQSGGKLTTFKQMIPDIEGATTGLQYSLFYRNSRSTGAPELETPPASIRPDGYVDFRATGRDIRLRLAVTGPQVNLFTLGQHLIDVAQRGDR